MATLDQPIDFIFQKQANALVLETGQQMMLEFEDSIRALTKESLSTTQIVKMIREIMPEGMHPQLESGDGRLAFGYLTEEHRVDVELDRTGPSILEFDNGLPYRQPAEVAPLVHV